MISLASVPASVPAPATKTITASPSIATIILASTSPRRKTLLALADIPFTTLAVTVDEALYPAESPLNYIQRMVATKADAAYQQLFNDSGIEGKQTGATALTQTDKIIITADTIGVLADGVSILVKPKDKGDAFTMWAQMSGNTHTVWTAVQLTVVDTTGRITHHETLVEKTAVTFIKLSQQDMEVYWQSGEPQDKAGGYAIQGKGALWVDKIEGSYTNVVGLPLSQTLAAIQRLSYRCLS